MPSATQGMQLCLRLAFRDIHLGHTNACPHPSNTGTRRTHGNRLGWKAYALAQSYFLYLRPETRYYRVL